jgi:hypothetical protein
VPQLILTDETILFDGENAKSVEKMQSGDEESSKRALAEWVHSHTS